MEPMSLLKLNETEIKEFLSSFDHVFSDCDGVIWNANNAYPGAGKFFELMKRLGKTVNFVSNNSLRSRENYEAKFKSAGIKDGFEYLTIPSQAIAAYLKSINFNKTIYCVTCTETFFVLKSNGFKCKEGPDVGTYCYDDYIEYLTDDEEIGAVIFDSDYKVNLPKLYKAITYLSRPEVLFISGATDKHVALKAGALALGAGIFTEIASQESKREPILLAKPGKKFGEFAMKRACVADPSRVLFIGDMIDQDVGLGRAIGFKTLLVLSNKTKEEMLSHETLKPDFYADSLNSMVPILESIAK